MANAKVRIFNSEGLKMKKINFLSLGTVLTILLLSSCSSKPGSPEAKLEQKEKAIKVQNDNVDKTIAEMPNWCKKLPGNEDARYSCGIGISYDLNLSRTRSIMNGKALLVDSIKSTIMSKIDNYTKTTGTKNNEQVKKRLEIISRNLIPETTLVGYKVTESMVINEKGKYRYFTLLEYPIGEKNQELLNQIKQDEILSTQKDADKAMADLEAEIEKRRKK